MHEPRLPRGAREGHAERMSNGREWAGHVKSWRASGESARAYCERRGLKLSRFRYWSSGVKRAEVERLTGPAAPAPKLNLARVRTTAPTRAPATASGPLRVVVGEVSVEVPSTFDPAALRGVVEVLVSVAGGRR